MSRMMPKSGTAIASNGIRKLITMIMKTAPRRGNSITASAKAAVEQITRPTMTVTAATTTEFGDRPAEAALPEPDDIVEASGPSARSSRR